MNEQWWNEELEYEDLSPLPRVIGYTVGHTIQTITTACLLSKVYVFSRQNSFHIRAMLDKPDTDGGTASGSLFWDDGTSIGE